MISALILLLWAGIATAEPFPEYQSLTVNDFADLLPAEVEQRLDQKLADLRARTGIEATVVTLVSQDAYDPAPSLETFATRLFNGWGIGDPTRSDGIMILVISADRAMRIELGAGYNPEYDIPAQDIINRIMLPAFRDGHMSDGIEGGTDAVISEIAERYADGLPPGSVPKTSKGDASFVALIAMGLAALLAMRNRIWRAMGRVTPCPSCGRRGITRNRVIDTPADRTSAGRGHWDESCPNCDWTRTKPFTIQRKGSGGRGSFGGGRSSGGGASGRW
ncbi:TPM domain-containing protein [Sedimentimonas flavescens]|uniref:TPM domain-containing protein n=1 Tax=Sedimentimonas flavescens TaxID=2851012 RepID=A0ABT2ZXV8_9RHOB|nr:TPM domain-containing protein [Sedimentimonas flavescens]MCV2878569.1 TPM domain-containing protein [Sedimentimonas flavescens]WBL31757.1 TPM domain-containing protein [Sinirhodobacter sp. HNIBRBA609]